MGDEREFKIRITTSADGSGTQKTAASLKDLKEQAGGTNSSLEQLNQGMDKGAEASERSHISHRALHLIFRQVGEASKGLEVGLMAVSGVMMGSLSFGIFAVGTAVKALIDHFERQKAIALEAAKATVQFWTDALKGNADARQAAADYATALHNIITNVDTLKQKEGEEEAVLKRVLEQRLKILDAERQAEIAAAKGDKGEEARINARYGQRKSDIELADEQDEIDLKKQHLEAQTFHAMKMEEASAAAEKAKEAGALGRSEASSAEARLPKLTEELATLQAARMKPAELAALKGKVAEDVEQFKKGGAGAFGEAALGNAMARAELLKKAQGSEQAYSAAQQEYEQSQADIERFKTDTAALAKAAADALRALGKAVETARATTGEISKAEAVHGVNVDAAQTIARIKGGQVIQAAGVPDQALSRSIIGDIGAMEGAGQGRRMDAHETEMMNHLVAGLGAQGNSKATILGLLKEMKDMHVDEAQKLRDIWAAIHQTRKQIRSQAGPL
jgi:hypothetical protein